MSFTQHGTGEDSTDVGIQDHTWLSEGKCGNGCSGVRADPGQLAEQDFIIRYGPVESSANDLCRLPQPSSSAGVAQSIPGPQDVI
jgi:hypothetical protein